MDTIREPGRDVPVGADVDLCVVGGSCTGVFAAVTAAVRRGHRVIGILEGFKWIMEGDTSPVVDLDEARVSGVHLKG